MLYIYIYSNTTPNTQYNLLSLKDVGCFCTQIYTEIFIYINHIYLLLKLYMITLILNMAIYHLLGFSQSIDLCQLIKDIVFIVKFDYLNVLQMILTFFLRFQELREGGMDGWRNKDRDRYYYLNYKYHT